MSNAEPVWHRSGDISFPWRGDVYEIYMPTIGEQRQIEEYGVKLGEEMGVDELRTKLKEVTDAIAEAKESGDEDRVAAVRERFSADLEDQSRQLIEKTQQQSIRWFGKVIELCGSDNWPESPDDYPRAFESSELVRMVKTHWHDAPLAWGVPTQNGTPNQTTVTNSSSSEAPR